MTGGGLTAQADAASFELLKEATLQYYKLYTPDELECKTTMSKDTAGNCVQITIKVCFLKTKDSYTVNLYLTKCSFLINGKSIDRFLETDLKNITKMTENASLNGNPVNISQLNAKLRTQLDRVLNCKAMARKDNEKIQSTQEIADKAQCVKCKKNVKSKAVYCEASDHWIHYNCDKLSEKEITDIEKHKESSYVCKKCSSERSASGLSESYFLTFDEFYQTFQNPDISQDINVNPYALSACSQILDSRTERKSLAQDILSEETSAELCSNCDECVDEDDSQVCEVCNRNCHMKCVQLKEDGIVCFGCDATEKQMNLVQQVFDDTVFDADNVITSTQLPTSDSSKSKEIKKPQTNCISTQTEGSFIDLQKKIKEMNLKEKQLSKKEYELSQISSQLTIAKSKIILLEKDISDLQKENELLKSNLLLARSSTSNQTGNGEIISNQTNSVNSIERRVANLEYELLKMKVGKLETEINANTCKPNKQEDSKLCDNTGKRLLNIEHTTEKLIKYGTNFVGVYSAGEIKCGGKYNNK